MGNLAAFGTSPPAPQVPPLVFTKRNIECFYSNDTATAWFAMMKVLHSFLSMTNSLFIYTMEFLFEIMPVVLMMYGLFYCFMKVVEIIIEVMETMDRAGELEAENEKLEAENEKLEEENEKLQGVVAELESRVPVEEFKKLQKQQRSAYRLLTDIMMYHRTHRLCSVDTINKITRGMSTRKAKEFDRTALYDNSLFIDLKKRYDNL